MIRTDDILTTVLAVAALGRSRLTRAAIVDSILERRVRDGDSPRPGDRSAMLAALPDAIEPLLAAELLYLTATERGEHCYELGPVGRNLAATVREVQRAVTPPAPARGRFARAGARIDNILSVLRGSR